MAIEAPLGRANYYPSPLQVVKETAASLLLAIAQKLPKRQPDPLRIQAIEGVRFFTSADPSQERFTTLRVEGIAAHSILPNHSSVQVTAEELERAQTDWIAHGRKPPKEMGRIYDGGFMLKTNPSPKASENQNTQGEVIVTAQEPAGIVFLRKAA